MKRLTISFIHVKKFCSSSPIQSIIIVPSSKMGRFKKIPDRWEDYSSIGSVMEGTRFIAFKVPLHFHPSWNLKELKKSAPELKHIVDLTNTDRYYKPGDCHRLGFSHVKIRMEGHGTVPSQASVERFYSSVLETEAEGGLIGVHCTHGLNRTGYLISRYLIEKLGWEPEKAIDAFDQARGHKQERANYLDHLKHKRWEDSAGVSNRASSGTLGEGQYEDERRRGKDNSLDHWRDNRRNYSTSSRHPPYNQPPRHWRFNDDQEELEETQSRHPYGLQNSNNHQHQRSYQSSNRASLQSSHHSSHQSSHQPSPQSWREQYSHPPPPHNYSSDYIPRPRHHYEPPYGGQYGGRTNSRRPRPRQDWSSSHSPPEYPPPPPPSHWHDGRSDHDQDYGGQGSRRRDNYRGKSKPYHGRDREDDRDRSRGDRNRGFQIRRGDSNRGWK